MHHRIASEWRRDRVFLMGDAAHLITPMWALGLNTGILDAISLPWRLAWVARGWADPMRCSMVMPASSSRSPPTAPAKWRKQARKYMRSARRATSAI